MHEMKPSQFSRARMSRDDRSAIESMIEYDKETLLQEEKARIEEDFEYTNLKLDHYHYSVNQKFDFRERRITFKKLVYLFTEAFSDLGV